MQGRAHGGIVQHVIEIKGLTRKAARVCGHGLRLLSQEALSPCPDLGAAKIANLDT